MRSFRDFSLKSIRIRKIEEKVLEKLDKISEILHKSKIIENKFKENLQIIDKGYHENSH